MQRGGFLFQTRPRPSQGGSCSGKNKKEVYYHMPQQYKIDAVAEIESKVQANAGVFVVNYSGLTVLQAQ